MRRFEFEDYGIVHDQIGAETPDLFAAEPNGNCDLTLNQESMFAQSLVHRGLINGLNETVPEFVVNLVENTNDPLCQFGMRISAFLRVKQRRVCLCSHR